MFNNQLVSFGLKSHKHIEYIDRDFVRQRFIAHIFNIQSTGRNYITRFTRCSSFTLSSLYDPQYWFYSSQPRARVWLFVKFNLIKRYFSEIHCLHYYHYRLLYGVRNNTFNSFHRSGHHLVENVIRSFQRLLGDDTSLFQQICKKQTPSQAKNASIYNSRERALTSFNISSGQFSRGTEMNTDEFTLNGTENTFSRTWLSLIANGLLTKRDELSLRTVLALPKASNTGLVCTTWSSNEPCVA